tara:strand:- start:35 stop:472 length:438 start_codon:yes stop_codon:yes gene_type:complete
MKIKWLAIALLTVLTLIVLLFPSFIFPQPPLVELTEARERLSEAEKSQASEYAPDLYKKATSFYDSAMVAWAKENDRFFFLKDFLITKQLAAKASETAISAKNTAQNMSKKIWSNYSKRLDLIDDQFERFDLKYKNIPLNENAVK